MQSSRTGEKRNSPREVFYREVTATNSVGKVHTLLSINYSNSGIALVSFTAIKVGEVFELEFTINDNNDSSKHKLTAEVVQNHNVSEIYLLGLQFQEEIAQLRQTEAS